MREMNLTSVKQINDNKNSFANCDLLCWKFDKQPPSYLEDLNSLISRRKFLLVTSYGLHGRVVF